MSAPIFNAPQPEYEPSDNRTPADIADAWDKAMKRAFKGLVMGGRPTARAALLRSVEASNAS